MRDAQTGSHGKNLSDLDYQFLAANQDLERQAIQQALAAARTREAETRQIEEQKRLIHEQKVTRLQRLLLGAVSTAFVITTGLGITAFRQYRQAALNELNALITSSKGLINSNEPFDALLEAIKAKGLAEKQNTNQAGTIVISHLGKYSERFQKGVYCSNSLGETLITFS